MGDRFPNMQGCRTWVQHPDGVRQCTRRAIGLSYRCRQHMRPEDEPVFVMRRQCEQDIEDRTETAWQEYIESFPDGSESADDLPDGYDDADNNPYS